MPWFVGYGNIAPKTFWGRLVCIAYAVLGIPLMLLCLANIGDVLADVFRFVYTKVSKTIKRRTKNHFGIEKFFLSNAVIVEIYSNQMPY